MRSNRNKLREHRKIQDAQLTEGSKGAVEIGISAHKKFTESRRETARQKKMRISTNINNETKVARQKLAPVRDNHQ